MRSAGSQNIDGRRDFTEEEVAKIRAWSAEGVPPAKIAQRIGRSTQSIMYIAGRREISLSSAPLHTGTRLWADLKDEELCTHDLSQYVTAPLTHPQAYARGGVYRGK